MRVPNLNAMGKNRGGSVDLTEAILGASHACQSPPINQQLAAVRRLAHEAADAVLLSPDLAAGISRLKGVKHSGSARVTG